jgi:cytochrome d ubiquinol oxidase subunit II
MFSGFYLALLLILFFLILRVLSFEWRGKSESRHWRRTWMWANAAGSAGIALIWGIALANLIHGLPLDSNGDYTGDLLDLFTVYTVFAGLTFVIVFAFHGASFLTLRTTGDLGTRAQRAARTLAIPAVAAGAAFLIWTVVVATDRNDKDVFPPVLPAAIGIVALVLAGILVYFGRSGLAFTMTAIGVVSTVATLFTSLYPRVMVSDPDFGNSLTVSNAASAHYTLAVLTVIAVIVTPIVVLYQAWSYYVFRARITGEEVRSPTDVIAKHAGTSAELP